MLNGFVVPDRLTVLFKSILALHIMNFQVVEIIEGGYDIPPSQYVHGGNSPTPPPPHPPDRRLWHPVQTGSRLAGKSR